ncbi:sensor domain-containing diguanylate cyclase [Psychromonas ossibalaenae]|uniref:sensor domain-containing diguanylate cyclase n=1 Tax=Psychromonas ossibalaenae TaxID=444922 RepID=UPI00036662E8|nr:sensor domain-containing diguanylate cyclase [Psychromonas ossibalaenae]
MQIIQQYLTDIEKCVRYFNISVDTLQPSYSNELLYSSAITQYKNLFLKLLSASSEEEIEQNTKDLVNFTIEHDISFLFLYSELVTIIRQLLCDLIGKKDFKHIEEIDSYFAQHEYRITILYLHKYLNKFKFKCETRLSHTQSIPDKNFMIHYENHLKWMVDLILYVQEKKFDDNYPELNPNLCEFGKWMKSSTASHLLSTSHYKQLDKLHINLHDLAANVVNYCKRKELRPATLIHLMNRIDYYSLEIGNEIAFLNEIELSAKDPLTHLLTRRLFNKIVLNKLDIAKASGREFSLMMCDLDHFKSINDRYGHAAGDIVLKHFSSLLEKALRKSDYIFRFGGEEFMILLPMTDKEEAAGLAQNICDVTASSGVIAGDGETIINYTVSIGIIDILVDNNIVVNQGTIDTYVSQVDEKLYLAKEKGRNRVE